MAQQYVVLNEAVGEEVYIACERQILAFLGRLVGGLSVLPWLRYHLDQYEPYTTELLRR